ncbi:twin-arginine translocase TatA/TatE family subunit [Paenibacillus ehimensis]|uniref:Sec-independent protein translocase protein TatA n=1 Tax=Paenibacillus ehimensis TaxID=79264 RepID=A0ABT8VM32_9BACL|nr:twin-arginine translocase TatA/TatE family subunit [Paenibacillus ehimensis]MDO3682024.1 twin-arginine translocase TatA/TatE family subunit [Paenibacillus ehimensis]MEC0213925.1 twin-arginine translocase TatA/TatE family subunit [Paenibacillus ehimensis]
MFGNIGFSEILLIGLIALLLFGPNKLPELGRALGKTLREFKQGARDLMETDAPQPPRQDVTPSASAQQPQPNAAPQEAKQDSRRLPD